MQFDYIINAEQAFASNAASLVIYIRIHQSFPWRWILPAGNWFTDRG